jgi:hypothetical protein
MVVNLLIQKNTKRINKILYIDKNYNFGILLLHLKNLFDFFVKWDDNINIKKYLFAQINEIYHLYHS